MWNVILGNSKNLGLPKFSICMVDNKLGNKFFFYIWTSCPLYDAICPLILKFKNFLHIIVFNVWNFPFTFNEKHVFNGWWPYLMPISVNFAYQKHSFKCQWLRCPSLLLVTGLNTISLSPLMSLHLFIPNAFYHLSLSLCTFTCLSRTLSRISGKIFPTSPLSRKWKGYGTLPYSTSLIRWLSYQHSLRQKP